MSENAATDIKNTIASVTRTRLENLFIRKIFLYYDYDPLKCGCSGSKDRMRPFSTFLTLQPKSWWMRPLPNKIEDFYENAIAELLVLVPKRCVEQHFRRAPFDSMLFQYIFFLGKEVV
ncbi:unnamed protein product [Albugo candida]|uniref:Uncharacterized protein n=1 Tax=Albugo candida TaxID=65357 RepID=A0A024GUJ1_9STRA|nr:unnamed protein product [Albugo candida]|eukprot:CCI50020.1 unnamed protein product [Albugo candida]